MQKSAAFVLGLTNGMKSAGIGQSLNWLGSKVTTGLGGSGAKLRDWAGKVNALKQRQSAASTAVMAKMKSMPEEAGNKYLSRAATNMNSAISRNRTQGDTAIGALTAGVGTIGLGGAYLASRPSKPEEQKTAAFALGFKTASLDTRLGFLGKKIGNSGSLGAKALEMFGNPHSRRARSGLGAAAVGAGGAAGLMGLSDLLSPPENDPGEGYMQARRPMRLMAENPNIARGVMGYAY